MENVKLALEINRMIHNECKDVPHDIGARIMELIEKDATKNKSGGELLKAKQNY